MLQDFCKNFPARATPLCPAISSASMGGEPRGHRAPSAPYPPTPRTLCGCPTGTPGSSALPPETTGLRPREEGGGRDGRAPASSPSSSQQRRSARCPAPPRQAPRAYRGAARAAVPAGPGGAGRARRLTSPSAPPPPPSCLPSPGPARSAPSRQVLPDTEQAAAPLIGTFHRLP